MNCEKQIIFLDYKMLKKFKIVNLIMKLEIIEKNAIGLSIKNEMESIRSVFTSLAGGSSINESCKKSCNRRKAKKWCSKKSLFFCSWLLPYPQTCLNESDTLKNSAAQICLTKLSNEGLTLEVPISITRFEKWDFAL